MNSFFKICFPIFILLILFSCHSQKKEEMLILENDSDEIPIFPYKPEKISVSYVNDSIFIQKIFGTKDTIRYDLFSKGKTFYFLNRKKISAGHYFTSSYLFLKNYGSDSCYSVLRQPTHIHDFAHNILGVDICLFNRKGGNYTTTARFVTSDSLSYGESIFYTRNYRIYKIALRYNNTLYWYKIRK